MPVLDGPPILPASAEWWLDSNTQAWESPLDKSVQTYELLGSRWHGTWTWESLSEDDWRVLAAWAANMNGRAGRANVTPPFLIFQARDTGRSSRGIGGGSPTVLGENQVGRNLNFAGGPAGQATWLKTGDYFHVYTAAGLELKVLTQDCATAANGTGTLVFSPPLRGSPSYGVPITLANPSCQMRFVDDQQARFLISPPVLGQTTIEMIEVW